MGILGVAGPASLTLRFILSPPLGLNGYRERNHDKQDFLPILLSCHPVEKKRENGMAL